MDATDPCHIIKTDDEANQKQASQFQINEQVDDAVPNLELHTVCEKRIVAVDTKERQSKDTATATPYSSTTVYLTGMPLRYCTETVIEKMMSRYGKIVRCTVHTQQSNKLFAFCEFLESSAATEAIREMNGRKLGGQHLLVRPAFKEGGSSVPSSVGTATPAFTESSSNPKRQRQQLDSKIEAIQRKLAKKSYDDNKEF